MKLLYRVMSDGLWANIKDELSQATAVDADLAVQLLDKEDSEEKINATMKHMSPPWDNFFIEWHYASHAISKEEMDAHRRVIAEVHGKYLSEDELKGMQQGAHLVSIDKKNSEKDRQYVEDVKRRVVETMSGPLAPELRSRLDATRWIISMEPFTFIPKVGVKGAPQGLAIFVKENGEICGYSLLSVKESPTMSLGAWRDQLISTHIVYIGHTLSLMRCKNVELIDVVKVHKDQKWHKRMRGASATSNAPPAASTLSRRRVIASPVGTWSTRRGR